MFRRKFLWVSPEQHQQRTLLRQIEDQDAYIRDLSLHADPDTISSEQEAQIAISTIKKSFLTVGYLVADCDSAEQRNETANAFQHAAAQYHGAAYIHTYIHTYIRK